MLAQYSLKYNIVTIFFLFSCVIFSKTNNPITTKGIFVQNKGQWPEEVKFLTQTNGLDAWIMERGVVYDFYKIAKPGQGQTNYLMSLKPSAETTHRYGHVIRMNFLSSGENSSPKIQVCDKNKLETYFNFFIGHDPSKWADHVPLYTNVYIQQVYDKINIRYYYDEEGFRYDLILEPGANSNDIQIAFEGSDQIEINN